MANPSTAAATPASSFVDEAVRLTAENSRRATDTTRGVVEQASAINRQLFASWIASGQTGLQVAFDLQNAALASAQAWAQTASSLAEDALRRWADLTRQAQQATLKTYQTGAQLVDELVTPTSVSKPR